ncbi:hypothetical protein HY251_18760 [bacterium]|nr:hypothetical protein [bacterium]
MSGANILLGVSGSIAAYKAADLASRLKKRGHSVTAILTRSACELISPNTFLNITGNRVFTELFEPGAGQTEHIALTDRADLVVVAPATANTIAKMALGLADDMLSTTLLAVRAPVLVCPAMNSRMWAHATVRRNLEAILRDGALVLEPDAGSLACGHVGPGRLAEPEAIALEVERILAARKNGEIPAPLAFFLERIVVEEKPSRSLREAEASYRKTLADEGRLVGSGAVGAGLEAVHVHRAASLEEARARAEASPLAKAGARVQVGEWHLDGTLSLVKESVGRDGAAKKKKRARPGSRPAP